MAEEKQVNEVAFLKKLNANKAALKAAAKEKRPDGIVTDAAIIQRFGIAEDGKSVTVNGAVSKIAIGNAKQDTNRPYFRFAYSVSDNSPYTNMGRGSIVSNYIELTEGKKKDGSVYRTEEEAYQQLFFEFQGVGEDTDSWDDPGKQALEAAKYHTKEKTPVSITLSTYTRGDGSFGLNVRVNPLATNEDLDSATVDEEGSEEEYSELPDEAWVGYWATWEDDSGPENAANVCLNSYDADSETFTGTGEDGEEYEDIPASQLTWLDPQPEE